MGCLSRLKGQQSNVFSEIINISFYPIYDACSSEREITEKDKEWEKSGPGTKGHVAVFVGHVKSLIVLLLRKLESLKIYSSSNLKILLNPQENLPKLPITPQLIRKNDKFEIESMLNTLRWQ